jgi:hypothetical protein
MDKLREAQVENVALITEPTRESQQAAEGGE